MPRHHLTGAMFMVFAIIQPGAANAFTRELEVYCVASDDTRTGVAASQDGATLSYIEAAGDPAFMVLTVHNRSCVADWHGQLDLVRLETVLLATATQPYCAIERTGSGGNHKVSWPQGETPAFLAPVFKTIMGLHGQGF
jgi:hypothetical protein